MSETTSPTVVLTSQRLSDALSSDSTDEEVPERPEPVTTNHTVVINGETISYAATAGTLSIAGDDEKPAADLFYVSYVRTDIPDRERRPITFAFNGGPGSSSVWLHLGMLGPRRVPPFGDQPKPPPGQVINNPHSLLDVTDLVFVDPVSTGYSRARSKASDYHGVTEDIESVARFIHRYVSEHNRWTSPKFLAGESYGTTRAAGLAHHLQSRHGMYLNGLVLISCALQFQTLLFDRGNDLPHILILPVFAATAWYHGLLPDFPELLPLLREVEAFAMDIYAPALLKGNRLSSKERTEVLRSLSRYTSIGEDDLDRVNLRLTLMRFMKLLLRDQRRIVGRLDSRFKGVDPDPGRDTVADDPSMSAIEGPYTAALNHYLRTSLAYHDERIYEILSGSVQPWKWHSEPGTQRYLDVVEPIQRAMANNPHLKMFVANGYFDLATPYSATDHTLAHLDLDESLIKNIQTAYYEAGHMMYIHEPALAQMRLDLLQFYADSIYDGTD